jgi:hypothetical protein
VDAPTEEGPAVQAARHHVMEHAEASGRGPQGTAAV